MLHVSSIGNRWQQNGIFASSLTFNGNNNRIDGASYDASGNMLNDGAGGHSFTYDAENRITSVTSSSGTSTYSYDANGNRVHRVGYPGTTCAPGVADYVFDLQGRWILQVNSSTTACGYEIYAGARHVGSSRGGNVFSHTDWLGTERVRIQYTYANNRYYDEHCASLPFGDDLGPCTSGSYSSPLHFTGKERDAESGLDNFGARYNASTMGRFMTPDPLGGLRVDPQTLNKYAYVRNNPINLTDPTGLYTCKDDNNQCKSKQDAAFEKSRQQDLKSKDPNVVRAAKAYGDPTKDGPGGNKVSVGFADLSKKGEGWVTTSTISTDAKGNLVASSDVTINSKISGSELDAAVGHEGSHVGDAQDVVSSISLTNTSPYFKVGADISRYTSEQRAYAVTDSILRSENESAHFGCGASDCVLGTGLTMRGQLTDTIDRILSNSEIYRSNGQPLSPTNQGGSVVNGLVPQ